MLPVLPRSVCALRLERHRQAIADRIAALPPNERRAAWKTETGRSQAALYRWLRKRTLDRQRIRYTPELLAAARAREAEFLGQIMPAVIRHANRRLRNLPHRREEYTQDALGNAWRHFLDLLRKGLEPLDYIGLVAKWAVLRALTCSSVCGQGSRSDVLSPNAQHRRGFVVFPVRAHEGAA